MSPDAVDATAAAASAARLGAGRAEPPATMLLTASGLPFDRTAIAATCRRHPSSFAIELVGRDDRSGRRVLGRAVLSTVADPDRAGERVRRAGVALEARAASGTPLAAEQRPEPGTERPAAKGGRVRATVRRLRQLGCEERRALGIADRPLAVAIDRGLGPVRWLRAGRDCAAPAPWHDDRLLCEERGGHRGRVRLLAATADAGGRLTRGRVLLEGAHDVAHPSIAEFEGRTFVLPSTPDASCTTLWRLSEGGGLAAVATIAAGRRLHDPTLFRADGLWWIAASDAEWGADDNLCLWHALRPHGPWRPHALNPVKLDCRSSRPAGSPFRAEGRLWRPAQDCSRGPGAAVMLNLVETLTPSAFREHPIRRLGPDRAMPHGIATVATWHDRTLVDGRRVVFSPRRLLLELWRAGAGVAGRQGVGQ